jgi:hypothetical protein
MGTLPVPDIDVLRSVAKCPVMKRASLRQQHMRDLSIAFSVLPSFQHFNTRPGWRALTRSPRKSLSSRIRERAPGFLIRSKSEFLAKSRDQKARFALRRQ